MSICNYQEIIDFWFDEEHKSLWFNSNPLFDSELKEQFESTYTAACEGELSVWEQHPEGLLALVILFDQFPLNMYRGDVKSFATEDRSRDLADQAIEKGWDVKLSNEQKAFLYMPFMHSENLEDQDRGIALFEQAGLNENAKFAHHHRDIIHRFGRFPHRNSILNRENTDAEKNYLISGEAFLG